MDLRFSQFEIFTGAGTGFLCLFFVCVFSEVSAIENTIGIQVNEAVASPDLYWSSAEVSGQRVTLTGTALDVAARREAQLRAWSVAGVSSVTNDIQVIGAAGNCQRQLNDYMARESIRFKTGQAAVADSSIPALGTLAKLVRKCAGSVEVAGHTDGRGDAEINLRLSQRRAEMVAKHLVRQGVMPEKIRAVGYGEAQPVAENTTGQGRKLNQRIEFRVLGGTE